MASQRRSLETVKRTVETVRRTIAANEKLASHPDHRESAEQRISEGHAELAELASEEARLSEAIRSGEIAAPGGESSIAEIVSGPEADAARAQAEGRSRQDR